MTHSPVQNRKKEEAMKESKHHFHNSNVMHTRNGMDHEDHKMNDLKTESKMGNKPGNTPMDVPTEEGMNE